MKRILTSLAALCVIATAAPLAAFPIRGDEPVGVPTSVEQGLDFVYVDPQLQQLANRGGGGEWMMRNIGFGGFGEPMAAPNPIFLQLRRNLDEYRMSWGRLPRIAVPAGPALKPGAAGERVDMLRFRLGLQPGAGYDAALADRVREYQQVHGLHPADGIAGAATIESLNRGPDHYERIIIVNLERARRLPSTGEFQRYVLVDSGAAEIYLVDHDRVADRMKAIVGSPSNKTPMMALLMQSARVSPYWNVPPDMVRTLTAPRVLKQGVSYLKAYNYEVLSDWGPGAVRVDPASVDWRAVAAGTRQVRVRQMPGPWNSMGNVKFETPNDYGIYLHDTPSKELFAAEDRWISNGCVRLEDARRFASWVMGALPAASGSEQVVQLPRPVPVYTTYLTAVPGSFGVQFRPDRYGFDSAAMRRLFGGPFDVASARL